MDKVIKNKRHKWVNDSLGKHCSICGSRINTKPGMVVYNETDRMGISDPVPYYPRCQYVKHLNAN